MPSCMLTWQQARESLKKITLSGGPTRDTSYVFMPIASDDDSTIDDGFDNAAMYFGEIVPESLDSESIDAHEQ